MASKFWKHQAALSWVCGKAEYQGRRVWWKKTVALEVKIQQERKKEKIGSPQSSRGPIRISLTSANGSHWVEHRSTGSTILEIGSLTQEPSQGPDPHVI